MIRIIEVGDDLERHRVGVGEPFDRRPCVVCGGAHQPCVRLVVRLARDIGGEQFGGILDTALTLEARTCRRNEPGRQGRRSCRHRVALDHNWLDAGLARGERRTEARCASADDQHRNLAVEIDIVGRQNQIHSATLASGVCHARCWPPSTASVTPVMLRALAR